jgi:hypothetical protein
MVSALAPTLHRYNQPFCTRPSTYATSLPVVTADVLPLCHFIGQCVNSVSILPHVPQLLTSTPQGARCCNHALCPQESDHRRDLFMPSHFEPSHQYPVKTIPNTLHAAHNLGRIFKCIHLLVHYILISSSTCHEILLTELLQYNNCSLASNIQDILALAP